MDRRWTVPAAARCGRLPYRWLVPSGPPFAKRQRLPAGPALRERPGARARLPRRFAAGSGALSARHRRSPRAAARSLCGAARGRDWEKHVERTTGDYAGIGLLVDARNGWITVVTPMPDSPAERAGIRTGDHAVRGGRRLRGRLDDGAGRAGDARPARHDDRPGDPPRGHCRSRCGTSSSASGSTSGPCRPACCCPTASAISA